MTKAERILRFIGQHPQGLRLGEISKFIYEMNFPGSDGSRRVPTTVWRKDRQAKTTKPVSAGYYGTNLLGGGMYGPAGLLDLFCTKTADRRYVLTEEIKPPFYSKDRKTKTLELNNAHREREHRLRVAQAPKCPSCGQAALYYGDRFWSPDKQAHMTSWGRDYSGDCKKRVWSGDNRLTTLTQEDLNEFHTNVIEPATRHLPTPERFDVADKIRRSYVISKIPPAGTR